MGELEARRALERIASRREKDRKEGLKDLRVVLEHNLRQGMIEQKNYHALFRTLFDYVASEKRSYAKASKPASKTVHSNSLEALAKGLRIVIDLCVHQLRSRAVKNLLEHIQTSLLTEESSYCLPLLNGGYIKCYRKILEYQPHVEHLSGKDWLDSAGFCLDAIQSLDRDNEANQSMQTNSNSRVRTPILPPEPITASMSFRPSGKVGSDYISKDDTDDLVICLRHLAQAPNSPLVKIMDKILTLLFSYLQVSGKCTYDAFATINSVLQRAHLESNQKILDATHGIIQIIKSLLNSRSVRNDLLMREMLICLICVKRHLLKKVLTVEEDGVFIKEVEALIDAMYRDYTKKSDRDILHIDDIRLSFLDQNAQSRYSLSIPSISLQNSRSENSWSTLYFIALFIAGLDQRKRLKSIGFETDFLQERELSKKRPRLSDLLDNIVNELQNPYGQTRVAALQILTFLTCQESFSEESYRALVDKLVACAADDKGNGSAWALIAIASAAFHKIAPSPSLSSYWIDIWQLASRNIATPSACRAACFVMNVLFKLRLVPYVEVAESVENILSSMELSGPATLSESSAELLVTILNLRCTDNPSHFMATSERILNWLFSKWVPSLFGERTYRNQNSRHTETEDLLTLLYVCMDRSHVRPKSSLQYPLGPLSQYWKTAELQKPIAEYMILSREESLDFRSPDVSNFTSPTVDESASYSISMETKIIEYCIGEVDQTRSHFEDWLTERPQNVSPDIIRLVTILCVIASNLSEGCRSLNARRIGNLRTATSSLVNSLAGFVNRRECSQEHVDSILDVLAHVLPGLQQIEDFEKSLLVCGAVHLCNELTKVLDERLKMKDSFYPDEAKDSMDVDDDFESQQSRNNNTVVSTAIESQHTDYLADVKTFRSSVTMHASFAAMLSEANGLENTMHYLPTSFVEQITSLQPAEFVFSHRFLIEVISSSISIRIEDLDELLMYISNNFLQSYEYKQNEVVEVMCLDIMRHSVGLWSDSNYSSLYNLGIDLYRWVIEVLLEGSVASSIAQVHIVDLLQSLLELKPNYAQPIALPSVRTSLFGILQNGGIQVKYHVADGLSDIFAHFVLGKHDNIFDDVHNSLPMDLDDVEGIAIRLLVLSKLGSAWHTLLRRCIYHIFETAGIVPQSVPYAIYCVERLSSTLKLPTPQKLYKLFARQLLFTWLDSQSLQNIPYQIFQYRTLKELLNDCQDEIFGQLFMRRREADLDFLAETFGIDIHRALSQNFAKAAAYSISWDTCVGSAKNNRIPSSEHSIRETLGSESYRQLIQQHFPVVIGVVLTSMEQEEQVNKAFSRNSQFHQAAKTLSEIESFGSSTSALPPNQQPSFNSKYLVYQIDRICRRIAYDSSGFWTPNIFVRVARILFDQITPALGSLHACSVIKKIRILISLASGIAVSGYPLQMLLYTLRPFLTDSQCADDTLGIMQYLFDRGRSSLNSHSSFVAGIGLSTLLTVQVALSTSQDSTTQENQYRATISKVNAFHAWITKYLDDYGSQQAPITLGRGSGAHIEAFKSIMSAASSFGRAEKTQTSMLEVKLLMEVLDDERSGRKLLSQSSRDLALSLVCKDFGSPQGDQNFITEDRERAAKFASRIWESCRKINAGNDYLIWAAELIGRTYGLQGEVKSPPGGSIQISHSLSSQAQVLKILSDLLYSDDRSTAGVAEKLIGLIISNTPRDESLIELDQNLDNDVILALSFEDMGTTEDKETAPSLDSISSDLVEDVTIWIKNITIALCRSSSDDPILAYLPLILSTTGLAERLFPFVLHMVLYQDFDRGQKIKHLMSLCFQKWFRSNEKECFQQVKILLEALSYLRTREIPRESNQAERRKWLDLDYLEAAEAAARCELYELALMLAETSVLPPSRSSRRSSVAVKVTIPTNLLLKIYANIDEPDSYYGVDQKPSLSSVLRRLDHEGDGMKSLLFRGAEMDNQIRRARQATAEDSKGIVRSLTMLNLNSVTRALLSTDMLHDSGNDTVDGVLHAARKLQQWDVRVPESSSSESAVLFRVFQGLHLSTDIGVARKHVDNGFLKAIKRLLNIGKDRQPLSSSLRTLAVLSEIKDLMGVSNAEELSEVWLRLEESQNWLQGGRFEDVRPILSCRETLSSVMSTNERLRESMRLSIAHTRKAEYNALIFSSKIYRKHGALQDSLASATYLTDIAKESSQTGLNMEAAATTEIASVLWDQGETTTAINMLKELTTDSRLESQMSELDRSVCLATLGQHIGDARLEKPEEIINNYLTPAIRELRGQGKGSKAGQVYHTFASFCDEQLQNSDAIDDIGRLQLQMQRKLADANEFEKLAKQTKSKSERRQYEHQSRQSRKWYDLDEKEYHRLRTGRETFLRQSLENYLLSLRACEDFNNDVLRVFALWLEFSDNNHANDAVRMRIHDVPSRKFVTLMNQLASRLQDEKTNFQTLLSELVFKICVDHPYHGMHQIYAGAMPLFVKDDAAKSRNAAATAISRKLRSDEKSKSHWHAIHESNKCYHDLAMSKDENLKNTQTVSLEKLSVGKKMMTRIPSLRVPPATMSIELRPSCDYSNVPKIVGFGSTATIASGLSAPKIVTIHASNGVRYKQLFKSGNDDLRQDAIMEQVFEQVSKLLRNHAATRLRNLHIRTYKVLPLSGQSGLIEFVQNTVPLVSYLKPAHHRYHPKEWKWDFCRSAVGEVQSEPAETRTKRFRQVMAQFHPVMRHFFLERFGDPAEWFARRLAYTRTTAAISILGHVLGLGDRHCANILLDERSGEVVHIDLGVAFEAGRVLPVPEVVPFRLTRDLVDAMGCSGTGGVFRRCCEFTLDTLRDERESIMTLLNVLRYDPLVNWSISPLRAKRMQEQQQQEQEAAAAARDVNNAGGNAVGDAGGGGGALDSARKREDEAGEAGRALAVVEKKLARQLSTAATVSELIQQATDERNLAVLFCGWAAYA